MINRAGIEDAARQLQRDIYKSKSLLCKMNTHPLTMLRPEIAAEFLDFDYVSHESIPSDIFGYEVAGLLDMQGQQMHISDKFPFVTRRFTAAHEVGHILLHPHMEQELFHRDIPVSGIEIAKRTLKEQEADYFAACYLIPKKQLIIEFTSRFGQPPIKLTETNAFQLGGKSISEFFIAPSGSLRMASAVASKFSYNGFGFESLVKKFNVSVSAMAIRLKEVGLVID